MGHCLVKQRIEVLKNFGFGKIPIPSIKMVGAIQKICRPITLLVDQKNWLVRFEARKEEVKMPHLNVKTVKNDI